MKHASHASLDRLATLLEQLRAISSLVERTPGSFYRRSAAFLHFHEDPAGLFADAKLNLANFERLPVNTPAEQSAFLRAVRLALSNAAKVNGEATSRARKVMNHASSRKPAVAQRSTSVRPDRALNRTGRHVASSVSTSARPAGLQILGDDKERNFAEVVDALAERFNLTAEVRQQLLSAGKRRLSGIERDGQLLITRRPVWLNRYDADIFGSRHAAAGLQLLRPSVGGGWPLKFDVGVVTRHPASVSGRGGAYIGRLMGKTRTPRVVFLSRADAAAYRRPYDISRG